MTDLWMIAMFFIAGIFVGMLVILIVMYLLCQGPEDR